MKTRVNLKLLGGLLVALLVLGAGIHFLHGYQVGRTAGELRARALEEEKSRNFSQSAEYLSLYLGYVPGDINARAQYGLIRAELASRARNPRAQTQAMVYLEGVLRSAPDRDDIRKRIAELAIELGRFPDAREHLNTLLKQSPDNAGWHYLYGQCEEAAKEYPQAADCYEKTIQHDPARVDSYARLADIQDRKLNKQSIAEKTLQSMVTANPLSSEAFVQRARFYQRLSRWDAAARDLDVARRLAPDDARVLLAAAEVAYAKREIEPARGCLKRGLELHPDDVRFYQQLARLELNVGRKKEARDVLHRILALRPSGTQSWYVASMLLDMNELAEARQLLRRLQKESSSDPQVRYLQARMLACESRWQEASQMLEDLVPLLATADYSANDLAMCSELLLAECYSQLGIPDQAVRAYQRAVKLDQESLPARVGLASAFVSASQIDDAIEEYRKLLPKMPQARMVLARLLILHNLSLPSGSRRWTEVDEVLAAARRAGESADEVKVNR